MAKIKPSENIVVPKWVFNGLINGLENLTVRFPIEGFASKPEDTKCKCAQFEDHEWCRHIAAVEALSYAKELKPKRVKA